MVSQDTDEDFADAIDAYLTLNRGTEAQEAATALRAAWATCRAGAAAWEFLTGYDADVPGATLAHYLDAARAYAYDQTGYDLSTATQETP